MWITFKKSCPIPAPINIGPTELERVSEFKLLGVYVQNDLKWNIVRKAGKRIHNLRVCRTAHFPRHIGLTTYVTKITVNDLINARGVYLIFWVHEGAFNRWEAFLKKREAFILVTYFNELNLTVYSMLSAKNVFVLTESRLRADRLSRN